MSIPKEIKIGGTPTTPNPSSGRMGNALPATSGVYLFKDKKGKVVYVGKATNLKSRVSSYWKSVDAAHSSFRPNRRMTGGGGRTIDEMLHEVRRIDWITTDSVIEALILEANLIRKYMPRYNVKAKDDKSFLYVVVTRGQWPKVELVRGNEIREFGVAQENVRSATLQGRPSDAKASHYEERAISRATPYARAFGPYTSASSIRAALDLIRKWFPWSTCQGNMGTRKQGNTRPCFDYHIGRCPGVCVWAVTRREYMKNIRNVILMLDGKKSRVLNNVEREMKCTAKEERFEEAEKLRRKLFALKHIRDVAVLSRDQVTAARDLVTNGGINIFGRIEGYDVSNISGTNAVGSMVVFKNGEPVKSEYRKFKIKTVAGINDVAMMREVLTRRFIHSRPPLNLPLEKGEKAGVNWPLPDLILIDGGWGQVNVVQKVIDDIRRSNLRAKRRLDLPEIPIVGIAKGFDRKQDQPIFSKHNPELARIVQNHKDLLLQVRDEAHRFAVAYHRKVRQRSSQLCTKL